MWFIMKMKNHKFLAKVALHISNLSPPFFDNLRTYFNEIYILPHLTSFLQFVPQNSAKTANFPAPPFSRGACYLLPHNFHQMRNVKNNPREVVWMQEIECGRKLCLFWSRRKASLKIKQNKVSMVAHFLQSKNAR